MQIHNETGAQFWMIIFMKSYPRLSFITHLLRTRAITRWEQKFLSLGLDILSYYRHVACFFTLKVEAVSTKE